MTYHPITPPPELVEQWYQDGLEDDERGLVEYAATQAARWGADQELEACVEWLNYNYPAVNLGALRAHRRPKPPSLKEQALEAQQRMWDGGVTREDWELVRRALEQLDD